MSEMDPGVAEVEAHVLRHYVHGAFNTRDVAAMRAGFDASFAIFSADGDTLACLELPVTLGSPEWDDPEATVRAAVTDVLGPWVIAGEFGVLSDDDVDVLSSVLREAIEDEQEEDEVSARALEALGANSHESTAEAIGEAYEAGNQRLRLASLRAMGRNASDDWLPVLLYNFDDEDIEIRVAAADASGQLLLEAAIDPLTELLEDDSEEVQLAAIGALGEIAGDDAERVLTAILGRPEPRLVEAASAALNGVRMLSIEFDDPDDAE